MFNSCYQCRIWDDWHKLIKCEFHQNFVKTKIQKFLLHLQFWQVVVLNSFFTVYHKFNIGKPFFSKEIASVVTDFVLEMSAHIVHHNRGNIGHWWCAKVASKLIILLFASQSSNSSKCTGCMTHLILLLGRWTHNHAFAHIFFNLGIP